MSSSSELNHLFGNYWMGSHKCRSLGHCYFSYMWVHLDKFWIPLKFCTFFMLTIVTYMSRLKQRLQLTKLRKLWILLKDGCHKIFSAWTMKKKRISCLALNMLIQNCTYLNYPLEMRRSFMIWSIGFVFDKVMKCEKQISLPCKTGWFHIRNIYMQHSAIYG